jgi:hypothetical protein
MEKDKNIRVTERESIVGIGPLQLDQKQVAAAAALHRCVHELVQD